MRDKKNKLGTLSRRSLIGGAAALSSVGLAKVSAGAKSESRQSATKCIGMDALSW